MTALRVSSLAFSIVLHGLALLLLVELSGGGGALDRGAGLDALRIDHGGPVENLIVLNDSSDLADIIESAAVEPVQPAEGSPPQPALANPPEPPVHEADDAVERASLSPAPRKPPMEREIFERPDHRLAQLETAAVPEQDAASSPKAGGDADLFGAYLRRLREALERNKVNPNTELTGQVLLRMSIDPSGRVLSREVLKSSGSKTLDDAALASLDRASPLPPLPSDLGQSSLEVSVPFKFRVH